MKSGLLGGGRVWLGLARDFIMWRGDVIVAAVALTLSRRTLVDSLWAGGTIFN